MGRGGMVGVTIRELWTDSHHKKFDRLMVGEKKFQTEA